jgi:hypothetical protein
MDRCLCDSTHCPRIEMPYGLDEDIDALPAASAGDLHRMGVEIAVDSRSPGILPYVRQRTDSRIGATYSLFRFLNIALV